MLNLIDEKLYNIHLFEKDGSPLGDGSIVYNMEKQLKGFKLNEKTNKLKVQHYMRTKLLKGINSAGIEVDKKSQ